jgi:hypothetical protein
MTAVFSSGEDDHWLIVTHRGFFAGSSDSGDLINVVHGLNAYPISQFYEKLYQPPLVSELLKGDPEAKYSKAAHELDLRKILDDGPAPSLELLEKRTEILEQAVRIKVRVKDEGGGIGRYVIWRVNGQVQGNTRTPLLERDGASFVIVEQVLKVDPGQQHKVEVVAYSKEDLFRSAPLSIIVDSFGPSITERARMHVLAIGVTDYENKGWRLPLAAGDAKAFADAMEIVGKGYFTEVRSTLVRDGEATTKGIEQPFAKIAKEVKPNDVFVLYIAGHGRYDGTFYFVPQNFNPEKGHTIRNDAISQDNWRDWIASVKVNKRVVVLDTCESAEGTGNFIRQLADPRLAAMELFQYATGDNLIAAAGQGAFESNRLGHGLLTYAILESLAKERGANTEELIKVDAVAAHAMDRVPVLSQEIFGQVQLPSRKLSQGYPVPIGYRRLELKAPAINPLRRNFILMEDVVVRDGPDPQAVSKPPRKLSAPMIVNILKYNDRGNWVQIQWGNGMGDGWVPIETIREPKQGPD